MLPRWRYKIVPLLRKQPVNCGIGAPMVPAPRVISNPTDTQEVRFGSSVGIRRTDDPSTSSSCLAGLSLVAQNPFIPSPDGVSA